MLPSKSELEKIAENYQKKADQAFQNYQDTGMRRYLSESQKNEDVADALRAAANVVEDRQLLGSIKGQIFWTASEAEKAIAKDAPKEELVDILNEIISYAVLNCNYKRRENIEEVK